MLEFAKNMGDNMQDSSFIIQEVINVLDSKKADDIRVIDLRDRNYCCDFVIVATAMIGRHSLSLLNSLKEELKPKDITFYAIDEDSEDWIIIDLGEVIVHIFTQNHRNKYNIEEFLENEFKASLIK